MKHYWLSAALLFSSSAAFAHPDPTETPAAEPEKVWPFFGKKSDEASDDNGSDEASTMEEFSEKLGSRLEKHSEKMSESFERAKSKNKFMRDGAQIESLEDMRDAARAVEEVLAESGFMSSFADLVIDLAEDFEVENNEDGMSVNFDGQRLGRVKLDKERNDSFDIEGFGRNLKIDRETVRRNGKAKTRIVIELDGEDDFDLSFTPKEGG